MSFEKLGRFIPAEVLFCEGCKANFLRRQRVEEPRRIVCLAEDTIPETSAQVYERSHNSDKEYSLDEEKRERLQVYNELLQKSYEEDPSELSVLHKFFLRYSKVMLADLEIEAPTFYWFTKAVVGEPECSSLIDKYIRFVSNELFATLRVDYEALPSIHEEVDSYSEISTHFTKAYELSGKYYEGRLGVRRQAAEPINTLTPLELFLYDLNNDPRSQPMLDEDFIWYMQKVEQERKNGIDNSSIVDTLILPHMGFVVRLAASYCREMQFGEDTYNLVALDLIQEGYLSLRRSFMGTYDWRQSPTQLGPVYKSVRTALSRAYNEQYKYSMIQIPVHRVESYKIYREFQNKFFMAHGRVPAVAEIAAFWKDREWSDSRIDNFLAAIPLLERRYVSTDVSVKHFIHMDIGETLQEKIDGVHTEAFFEMLLERVKTFLQFNDLHRQTNYHCTLEMLARKLGIWTGDVQTLEEIGEEFGISRQRVHQKIKPLLERLRLELIDSEWSPLITSIDET